MTTDDKFLRIKLSKEAFSEIAEKLPSVERFMYDEIVNEGIDHLGFRTFFGQPLVFIIDRPEIKDDKDSSS